MSPLLFIRRGILFLCFAATCHFNAAAQNPDIDLLNHINPKTPSSGFWQVVSPSVYMASYSLPAGMYICGVLAKDKDLKRNAWQLTGTILISGAVTHTLKTLIRRKRPYESYPGIIHPYKPNYDHRSMPSGHTSLAFATATGIALEYRKWYIAAPALAYAAAVGYSRMYLGVHYPSDVLAGAAVGVGSAWLSHYLAAKLFQRKRGRSLK
ncbi:phosphatase PAP2 family protein [Foetidibacter luteolus]|uniref:phosphatase PAP2 family protein n=1 Tax=Foetidibacter luteolus TaxID=2608880 RepID=UPI00129BFFFE|nr:phosphatase PAP2 family protein [Foetidibacter luteolus]